MTAMLSTPALIHRAQTAAEQLIEGMERLPPVPEVLLALQDLRDAARVLRLDPALLTWSQRQLLNTAVQRMDELHQLLPLLPAPLKA